MLRKRTAEVMIELKAVVDARYRRPYIHTKTKAAIVVRTGNSRRLSMWEKYFEAGIPFWASFSKEVWES